MTETNATNECCCTCQSWQNEIVACGDPVEIARKVKLAFKKMPGEMALACFAKVMTAELPHPTKVAVWDTVRYSHIWWGVDEVLKGSVMDIKNALQDGKRVSIMIGRSDLERGDEDVALIGTVLAEACGEIVV